MREKYCHIIIIIASLASLVFLSGCQQKTKSSADNKIQIVASTPTYGQMAQSIAGKYGHVVTIMSNSNSDPHDFEPSVLNARQTSQAQVAIYNGLGYDAWMERLLVNNHSAVRINVGHLLHKKMGSNPHLWYNPQALPKTAESLAIILGNKKPNHQKYFQKQAQKYIKSLQPLQKQIIKIKQTHQQDTVAVSEPVFDYSLQAMGYQIANSHFAQAIEEGADPSPQDIKQVQALIKQHKIAFWLVNQQADNPIVDNLTTLAIKNKIPVMKVSETQPAQLNYKQWLQNQYQKVITIEAKNGEKTFNYSK